MPNPYPIELRERAVHAYEESTDTYVEVAARFSIAVSTLCEWVRQSRDAGHVMPAPKGGGWYSPVDLQLLHALITERPDRTTEELTRAYNQRAAPEAQVHRSSVLRALQRTGGNKKAAARMLGLSRRALYRRLERLNLTQTISRRKHLHSSMEEKKLQVTR